MLRVSIFVPLVSAKEWEFPQATWITAIGIGVGTRLQQQVKTFGFF